MPIYGRTSTECVEQFRNVLAKLVRQVLHKTRPVRALQVGDKVLVGIFDEEGTALPVRLNTPGDSPPLFLQLWQTVEIVDDVGGRGKRAFRLRTLEYNYHLSSTPQAEPLLRWEYVKRPKNSAQYCRNHLQGAMQLEDGSGVIDFKKMHVPTGYLLLEEVFRFIIDDLAHRPPCGEKWPEVLEESKHQFFEELSSKPSKYDGPQNLIVEE